MPVKKTFYPSKTFDDDLAAFVDMCATNGWQFPGISLKSLQAAVKAQRSERLSHDAQELSYYQAHENFGLAQAQRHALFSSALHAARGLFRNDKAVLAQLDRFTRNTGRRGKRPTKEPGVPDKPATSQLATSQLATSQPTAAH